MRKATLTLARPLVGFLLAILCLFTNEIYGQQQFDVALTKTTVTSAPVQYGIAVPFNFTIYNQGTDTIMNVELIDHFGDGFEFQGGLNMDWSEHLTIVNAVTTTYTEKIPPGQNRIVTLNLIVRPGSTFEDWRNTGEVVSFTDVNLVDREDEDLDSDGNENPIDDAGGLLGSPADNAIMGNGMGAINDGIAATDEDDHDRDSIQVFDLAITKILDPITGYSYGDTLTFNITVYNQGNMKARIVRVRDIVPEGYINPIAENVADGWSNDATNPLYTIDSINAFDQAEISIRLILDPTSFDENAWDNYSEIFSARDENLVNVSAFDADSSPASNSDGERSVRQGDPDDNNIGNTSTNPGDQDDHDPASPVVFDLALIKERTTALSSFNYGTPIEYTYTVQNQGNVDATNIVLHDSLPCGAMFDETLNPGWDYDDVTRIATITILSLDASTEIQGSLTLTVIPCTIDQETAWTNYMEISSATTADGVQTVEIDGVFDTNMTNDAGGVPLTSTDNALDGIGIIDEDNHDVELLQVYDLALKKELITTGPYSEGQELDFRIRVYNQGNIVIEDLIIEDFIPEGYGYDPVANAPLGWTNSYTTLVGGMPTLFPDTLNVMEEIFLATEDSIDIFIKLNLELDGTDISDWFNYAHIWVASDTVGNNRFDDADSNPFNPTSLEFAVVPGSPNDDNIFSEGKAVTPQVEEDDHDVANIDYFDLSLSKNLPVVLPTGYNQDVTFNIVVRNEGVQFAHDITIVDYIPCGFEFNEGSNTNWFENIATGNPEYFYTDTLYPGEEITIPITLNLVECLAPDNNAWRNIAEIKDALDYTGMTGDDQDSTPDDDPSDAPDGEDDINDAFIEVFDLSLTKSVATPPTSFNIGSPVTYNIIVTNDGNVPALNTLITDHIPCGLDFNSTGNTGWSVNGSTGNLEYTISTLIQPGASEIVSLTLTIGSCISDLDFNNVAEISDDGDETGDPVNDFDSTPDNDPDNNDDGEDDIDEAGIDFYDLSLSKVNTPPANLAYGEIIEYSITVLNEGTIPAQMVEVTEYLACGLEFDENIIGNQNWNLDNTTGYLTRTLPGTINPGGSSTVILRLTIAECANPTPDSWNNLAEISGGNDPDGMPGDDEDSTPDNDPTNDPDGEDDIDSSPFDVYDLSLSKTVVDPQPIYELTNEVTYEISITNQGSLAASNVGVVDYIPCGMTLPPNSNWDLDDNGYATLNIPGPIASGATVEVFITLIIDVCDNETGIRNNAAEIANGMDPTGGMGDDFDSTPDNIPGNDPENEDDIDNVEIAVAVGANIGDFVFNDFDGDGIQDNGEPGISYVMVILYDIFDNVVAATITDDNGFYEFEDIPGGDYYVVFDNSDEDLAPTLSDVGNDAFDSDITEENGPGSTAVFTLVPGQDNFTIDAGFFQCLDIKGVSYYDINEDDIRQTTENGINGLVVNLYRRINNVWTLWDSETTHHDYDTPSDDGIWDFCVPPGTYYIEVEMPPIGLVRVIPFKGGANFDSDINGANGPNTTPTFTLNPGGSKTNLGAGYYPMATVGNRVWFDENANGIQEDNEPKVEGVNVQVYNMDNELVDEAMTNEQGIYKVEYLQKEDYYLKFEAPDGMAFTFADAIDDEDMDSDVTHNMGFNTTDPISFKPGDDIKHIDAGMISSVLPLKWKDFYVERLDKLHSLTWITARELNGDYFEIQRKLESENEFYAIGELKAVGNSLKDQKYNFRDIDIDQEGAYYYRIKQVDLDGKYSLSDIVIVRKTDTNTINNFPNPASESMSITGLDVDASYSIKIVGANGVAVMQFENEKSIDVRFDIGDLTSGVYEILVLDNNNIIYQNRFIKL